MTPKSPKALPKISITRILTKVSAVWASANAHPLPVIPTHTPHNKLENPTDIPVQNIELPANQAYLYFSSLSIKLSGSLYILPNIMIAIITP